MHVAINSALFEVFCLPQLFGIAHPCCTRLSLSALPAVVAWLAGIPWS